MSDHSYFEYKAFFNGVYAAIGAAIIAVGYKIIGYSSKKAVPYVVKKGIEDALEIVKNKIVNPEIVKIYRKIEILRKEIHSVVTDKNAANGAVFSLEKKFVKTYEETNKKMDLILAKMDQDTVLQNDLINEIKKRLK